MPHPARSTLEPPDYDGHFVMIPLTQGRFAIVDEADAEMILNSGSWQVQASTNTCYAKREENHRTILMHAVIAGSSGPDHVNRNGLDNRRINLRRATPAQNVANKPPTRRNTSGYKGVSWHQRGRKWRASIKADGRMVSLGLFSDPAEAARAYNAAALELWGEFAWLNPA